MTTPAIDQRSLGELLQREAVTVRHAELHELPTYSVTDRDRLWDQAVVASSRGKIAPDALEHVRRILFEHPSPFAECGRLGMTQDGGN